MRTEFGKSLFLRGHPIRWIRLAEFPERNKEKEAANECEEFNLQYSTSEVQVSFDCEVRSPTIINSMTASF